ncbi:MAG TPA: hypothetical protein VMW24_10005, partial [Sedimentisphaerales bacterium]|nr:hypothetical protein [Sedimentisphaerales bacterium]
MDSRFADEWTSSLGDILVSPGPTPASGKARTTLDTFGRILQRSCEQFSLFGASSRTSPDTCPLDSPPFIEAYELWATKLRQDCLQRPSAARPTSGSGCSSWPTVRVADEKPSLAGKQATVNDKGRIVRSTGEDFSMALCDAVQVNWPTPQSFDSTDCPSGDRQKRLQSGGCRNLWEEVATDGRPDPDSPSTNGKNRGLWTTPKAYSGGDTDLKTGQDRMKRRKIQGKS